MRRGALALAGCALALVACGGGATSSADPLLVTADPRVTPRAPADPGFSCTPKMPGVGTVSDLVMAGPCTFSYLGSATGYRPDAPGGFGAGVQLDLEGGGSIQVVVQASKRAAGRGTVSLILDRGDTTAIWAGDGTVTVAQDRRSVTVRPVAMPSVDNPPGAGVETVRGVLTCP